MRRVLMAGLLGAAGVLSCGDDFSGNLPPEVILPQGLVLEVCTTYSFDFAANVVTAVSSEPREKCDSTTRAEPFRATTGDFDPDSFDLDGKIVKYRVDWGDGSPVEESPTSVFTHMYKLVSPYTLSLTATDDDGLSAQGAVNLTVF